MRRASAEETRAISTRLPSRTLGINALILRGLGSTANGYFAH